MPTLSQRINTFFAKEEWAKARALIDKELDKTPDSHWLLARLSTAYHEQRKYAKALEVARQAQRLAPECPLVLWDLAGALDATGDLAGALEIYRKLIRRGPVAVGNDECGEGLAWAIALLVDCVYRIGLCLEHLGNIPEALLFYHNFLELRSEWKEGIYSADDAERRVARLTAHKPDYLERELGKLRRDMAGV
jgi:tetratricopeptide (TPR) repeat protein